MCIATLVVKCSDRSGVNGSEGVPQAYILRSRAMVWGAKMIRYRCSPHSKCCLHGTEELEQVNRLFQFPQNEKSKHGFRGEYVRKYET